MKKILAVAAIVSLAMTSAAFAERDSSAGGPATKIENSVLDTHVKADEIKASGHSKVEAGEIEVGRGTKVENSRISTDVKLGKVKTSDHAEVEAGGVKLH